MNEDIWVMGSDGAIDFTFINIWWIEMEAAN